MVKKKAKRKTKKKQKSSSSPLAITSKDTLIEVLLPQIKGYEAWISNEQLCAALEGIRNTQDEALVMAKTSQLVCALAHMQWKVAAINKLCGGIDGLLDEILAPGRVKLADYKDLVRALEALAQVKSTEAKSLLEGTGVNVVEIIPPSRTSLRDVDVEIPEHDEKFKQDTQARIKNLSREERQKVARAAESVLEMIQNASQTERPEHPVVVAEKKPKKK